jgi:hypothetical protein
LRINCAAIIGNFYSNLGKIFTFEKKISLPNRNVIQQTFCLKGEGEGPPGTLESPLMQNGEIGIKTHEVKKLRG